MAIFVNFMGDLHMTREGFEDYSEVKVDPNLASGGEIAIGLGLEGDGEPYGVINLIAGSQAEYDAGKMNYFNKPDDVVKVPNYLGSLHSDRYVNGLFSQGEYGVEEFKGIDLVENEDGTISEVYPEGYIDPNVEPLIWVACQHFALANGIKNRLMVLPLDDAFLVCLVEGAIRYTNPDADDEELFLTRGMGGKNTENLKYMTSTPGNIQGLPEDSAYEQSFLSMTIQRKIGFIIPQKRKRNGNEDRGLTTQIKFDRKGTVLLDGGTRILAEITRQEEEERQRIALEEFKNKQRAEQEQEAKARAESDAAKKAEDDASFAKARNYNKARAAKNRETEKQDPTKRNTAAAMFLANAVK